MSESRLAERWTVLRRSGRAALIPYVTAGYPDGDATRTFLRGAAAAGADLVELGVPWSDPVADGPVIQASTHAAIAGGMTVQGVLALLAASAPAAPPIVLFSYLNPILAYGPRRFAEDARRAGAAGLLVTDLPVGAAPEVEAALREPGLPLVRLAAPTSGQERLAAIAAASEGFVYLLARLGVTGATADLDAHLAARVAALRAVTALPVAVGFGIADPAQAAAVARCADGVVIGSALVARMAAGPAAGLDWLATVRNALDHARSAA